MNLVTEPPMLFDTTPVDQALDTILSFQYPNIDITPLVLSQSIPKRLRRKEGLDALLLDIEKTIIAVQNLEAKIVTIRNGLRGRAATVANACAAISAMPAEILQDIFRYTLWNGDLSLQPASLKSIRLSHVSSQWRAVSLRMPELWDSVTLPSEDFHGSDGMLVEFGRRSAQRALTVHINKPARRCAPIQLESGSEYAVSSLTYRSDSPAELCRFSAQNLDSLVLHYSVNRQIGVMFPLHNSFFGLKKLTLHGMPVTNLTGDIMERLEEINVSSLSLHDLTESLASIDAPLLQNLRIADIYMGPEGPERANTLLGGIVERLLGLSIVHLELELDDWMAWGFIFPMLERWRNSSITSLSIILLPELMEQNEYDGLDDVWAGFVRLLLTIDLLGTLT